MKRKYIQNLIGFPLRDLLRGVVSSVVGSDIAPGLPMFEGRLDRYEVYETAAETADYHRPFFAPNRRLNGDWICFITSDFEHDQRLDIVNMEYGELVSTDNASSWSRVDLTSTFKVYDGSTYWQTWWGGGIHKTSGKEVAIATKWRSSDNASIGLFTATRDNGQTAWTTHESNEFDLPGAGLGVGGEPTLVSGNVFEHVGKYYCHIREDSPTGEFGYVELSSDFTSIVGYTKIADNSAGNYYTEAASVSNGADLLCIVRKNGIEAGGTHSGLAQFAKIGAGSWAKVGELAWQDHYIVNTPGMIIIDDGSVLLTYTHRQAEEGFLVPGRHRPFSLRSCYGNINDLLTDATAWSDVYSLAGFASYDFREVGFGSIFRIGDTDASLHQIYCDNTSAATTGPEQDKLDVWQAPCDLFNESTPGHYDKDLLCQYNFAGPAGVGAKPLNIKEESGHGGHRHDEGQTWTAYGLEFNGTSDRIIIDKLSGFKDDQYDMAFEAVIQSNDIADHQYIMGNGAISDDLVTFELAVLNTGDVYGLIRYGTGIDTVLATTPFVFSPTQFFHIYTQLRYTGSSIDMQVSVNGETFTSTELSLVKSYKSLRPIWLGAALEPTDPKGLQAHIVTPRYLHGTMAFARIWNRSHTQGELGGLYDGVRSYLFSDRGLVLPART